MAIKVYQRMLLVSISGCANGGELHQNTIKTLKADASQSLKKFSTVGERIRMISNLSFIGVPKKFGQTGD